ncbi:MAG: O-antigen ligase family protein [Clostridia bacterium]|nr:O-antigen ligase family protein [Clostridia bacterium]
MKFTERLSDKSHIIAAILIMIQPVMDVISFWLSEFGISNAPTLLLRMAVLAATLVSALILTEKKKAYFITLLIMAVIYLGHVFACIQVGFADPVGDFTNYVRVIQTPLLVMSLITFMKHSEKTYDAVQFGACAALIFIFAVEAISTLTGTDPHTYSDGAGIIGWFNNTNSQSSSLCVLSPILLLWQFRRKNRNILTFTLAAAMCCLSMFMFATRLAYLGLIALTVGMGIMIILIERKKSWQYGVVLLAMAMIFIFLLPVSPTVDHLNLSDKAQTDRQQIIDAELSDKRDDINNLIDKLPDSEDPKDTVDDTDPDKDKITEDEKERLIASLTPIYERHVGDFVKRFGAEETMEMYDYTLDVRRFASTRAKKLMFAEMLMQDSPESTKWFGVELSRFTFDGTIYDVENDFHGIYFLYGRVGFVGYIAFIGYFVLIIAKALIKDFKKYFTVDAVAYGIAFLCCMAHAYNTAGVLRRPNASVYLSVVLAVIYYLIYIRKYSLPEKIQK